MTGLLLILGSVALGGHLIGTASETTAWVGVARSLPAGHVLVAADLRTVRAHLPASAGGRYFAAAPTALIGKTLSSPVQAGELLTATALAKAATADTRIVPVVVHAGRLPALAAGDRVDVYVLAKSSGTNAAANGREERVLAGAEFVSQDLLNSGDTSVQLRVAPHDAITVVAASQSGRVDLVRAEGAGGTAGRSSDDGPSSVAGFGGS
jgi:hypothetical protein